MPDSKKPSDPQVEVPEGLTNVLFDVWLVSRATTAMLDETLRPSGLDADEFAVYSVLASGDGMTPSDLAQWMSAPATTVSSYVKRFEARGHVQRAPHPDDGRSYLLQLTAAGRRVHCEAGAPRACQSRRGQRRDRNEPSVARSAPRDHVTRQRVDRRRARLTR